MPVDSLNFSGVQRTVFPAVRDAARLKAVLLVHNELPKDEMGVATITIRNLIQQFVPGCDRLLKEYVCAFGAHGIPVLDRFVQRLPDRESDPDVYAAVTQDYYAEFKNALK